MYIHTLNVTLLRVQGSLFQSPPSSDRLVPCHVAIGPLHHQLRNLLVIVCTPRLKAYLFHSSYGHASLTLTWHQNMTQLLRSDLTPKHDPVLNPSTPSL